MFTITKDFTFAASHALEGLAPDHKCARLHGHNYIVRVEASSQQVDFTGFVVDYGALSPFGDYLDSKFDHKHLNDLISQPTAENLARYFHAVLSEMFSDLRGVTWAVGVSETPKTWAWYRR